MVSRWVVLILAGTLGLALVSLLRPAWKTQNGSVAPQVTAPVRDGPGEVREPSRVFAASEQRGLWHHRIWSHPSAESALAELFALPLDDEVLEATGTIAAACREAQTQMGSGMSSATHRGLIHEQTVRSFVLSYCAGIQPATLHASVARQQAPGVPLEWSPATMLYQELRDELESVGRSEALADKWTRALLESRSPNRARELARTLVDPSGALYGGYLPPGAEGWPRFRRELMVSAVAELIACHNAPLQCAPMQPYTLLECVQESCSPGMSLLEFRRQSIAPLDWAHAERIVSELRRRVRDG